MMRSEDLALRLGPTPPPDDMVRGGQGTVIAWNPETGENVVRFRGTDLTNLPIIASSTEVLQIQPGDEVRLDLMGGGGFTTIYVIGRIKQPGPEIRDIIRSAVASNIFSASVAANETTTSASYGNLTTTGPTVSNVPIGSSGRALVLLTSLISANAGTVDATGGIMSYEVSGATSRSPADAESLMLLHADFALNTWTQTRNTAVSFVSGLTPGLHTFTAKYKAAFSGAVVAFEFRNLTVVAF